MPFFLRKAINFSWRLEGILPEFLTHGCAIGYGLSPASRAAMLRWLARVHSDNCLRLEIADFRRAGCGDLKFERADSDAQTAAI